MVLSAEVYGVHVHTAVIGPVVCQRNNELGADLLSSVDHLVKMRNVDLGCAIAVPPLKDNLGRAGTFAAIVGKAARYKGPVLIVETPGPKSGETCLFRGCQTLLNVGLRLSHNVSLAVYPIEQAERNIPH